MTVIINGSLGVNASTTTQSLDLPIGTTAQRPSSPTTGSTRFNTTLNYVEIYANGSWQQITLTTYSINYLIAAGGGGGGTTNGGGSTLNGGGGGAGGSGGGGNGRTAGTANTGGGGGGGAAGGSGIVIISYAGAQKGTGGTVTTSGGNTIHTFTTSGTYTA